MPANVHVKQRLTNLSVHYPWDFVSVGEAFFPKMPTEHLSNQFPVWNKANLLQMEEATPLGDDEDPPEVELVLSPDKAFNCKVYGLQSPGKWITEKNADVGLDYEGERSIQLTTALRLRLEYLRVNQRLRSTAVMTNNSGLSAGQKFDNYPSGTSTPITMLQMICDNIGYENGGRKPNRIAMTTLVLRAITRSLEFKDMAKTLQIQNAQLVDLYTTGGLVALVEQLIGVKPGSILISDAVYNCAQANQTPVYTTFMGPDIAIGYVEPSWAIRAFSLSAGFQWNAYSNDPQSIISVTRTTKTMVPVEDLRVFTVIDPSIIVPNLGYLIQGAISTTADSNGYSYGQLVAH